MPISVSDHVDIYRTVSVPPGPEGPLDAVVTAVNGTAIDCTIVATSETLTGVAHDTGGHIKPNPYWVEQP